LLSVVCAFHNAAGGGAVLFDTVLLLPSRLRFEVSSVRVVAFVEGGIT
jgi:hypothetical protein